VKPISIQLYSVRELASKDFAGVLKKLAKIGYKGVEPAGFWNLTPKEFKKIVADLGMEVSSTHSPWVKPDNIREVTEVAGILGIDLVICGFGPNDFVDLDAIKRTAETVNGMLEKLKNSGLTLVMHNHYWEFERLGGQIKYDLFRHYCPGVKFELDTYWACNFGAENPVEQMSKYRHICPLLHIKDGTLIKDKPLLPVGAGKNNIAGIVHAADPSVLRWLVVEQDNGDGDMIDAAASSYRYMIENGLAIGNK
jgi:sugar phosphate isomerase/epimerase